MKYRIKEFDGEFTIEVWEEGRKKRKGEWTSTDAWGDPWTPPFRGPSPPFSPCFKSLGEARGQIKIWEKGTIYHEP